MTAGISLLRSISWPGKKKRRSRSKSGGSEKLDISEGNENSLGRKLSGLSLQSISTFFSSLEQTSSLSTKYQNTEFKCSWPIKNFKESIDSPGLDSKHFKVNLEDITTTWNLSIRFWHSPEGLQISSPFLVCINLLERSSDIKDTAEVSYKISALNRETENYEECSEGVATVSLKNKDRKSVESVAAENIALKDEHYNDAGDILLQVRLSFNFMSGEDISHSKLPSFLLSYDQSPDLILICGKRKYPVHKKILASSSSVLDGLIKLVDRTRSDKKSASDMIDKLVINDLNNETLYLLLKYIYTGAVSSHGAKEANLLKASIRYQLPGLQIMCEKQLGALLTPTNVSSMLLLADSCSSSGLKELALQYCKQHVAYIVKDSDWTCIEQNNEKLWLEACSVVETEDCRDHKHCVRNTRHRVLEQWDR